MRNLMKEGSLKFKVASGALLFLLFFAPEAHAATISKPAPNLGLIGWWALDEGSGTKAIDRSGNGRTGTLTNSPTRINGKRGKALNFDSASTQYVSVGSNLLSDNDPFTIAAWVSPAELTSTWKTVFAENCNGPDIAINQASVMAGRNCGQGNGFNMSHSLTAAEANTWIFLSMTFDGANARLYKNGTLVAGPVASTFAAGGHGGAYIGSYNGANELFNGKIDDVRLYNRALSTSEVFNLFRSSQQTRKSVSNLGLVGWWKMDEGTSTKAHDFSGQGNTGTLISSPTWSEGKRGKSLYMNGGYVNMGVGSSALDAISNVMTISAWIKTPTPNNRMTIYSSGYVCCNVMFGTGANNPGGLEVYYPGVWISYTNSGLLLPDTWYHVVYTRSGTGSGTHKFYINGVSQALSLDSATNFSAGAGGTKYIGYRDGYQWTGNIDDVRVYDRALSDSEVAELYGLNETKVGGSQESRVSSGLVGYWSFNGKDIDWAVNKAWDRSGYDRHGTLVSMSTSSTPVAGKVGQAINFAAASEYVQMAQPISSSPFTIAMWYYPNAINGSYEILYSGTDNDDLQLFFHGTSKELTTSIENYEVPAGLTLSASTIRKWYSIVWTFDGVRRKVYVNGAVTSDIADTTAFTINDASVRIGMLLNGGSYTLNGKVDEVRVYNRALSASEANQLYLLGK